MRCLSTAEIVASRFFEKAIRDFLAENQPGEPATGWVQQVIFGNLLFRPAATRCPFVGPSSAAFLLNVCLAGIGTTLRKRKASFSRASSLFGKRGLAVGSLKLLFEDLRFGHAASVLDSLLPWLRGSAPTKP